MYRKLAEFARGGNNFVGLYNAPGEKKGKVVTGADRLQKPRGGQNPGHLSRPAGPGGGAGVGPAALGDKVVGLPHGVLTALVINSWSEWAEYTTSGNSSTWSGQSMDTTGLPVERYS